MTDRISAMRAHVQQMNDVGVRRTYFYPMAYESLKETRGESIQLRRAKAEAYLLAHSPIEVHPYELIVGTMTAYCPEETNVLSIEQQRARARAIIDQALARKREGNEKQRDRTAIKTFETEFTTRKSRWALMSRVYHDGCVSYRDFQRLIKEMKAEYASVPELEGYEFGRELERGLKVDYGEAKREVDRLPWFAANHLALNYGRLIRTGFGSVIRLAEEKLATAEGESREYYECTLIVANAAVEFIRRYARECRTMAVDAEPSRATELIEMGLVCDRIAEAPAKTFREGVQLLWLLHIMMSVLWGSSLALGRFDQYMRDLYEADIASGRMTREEAREILRVLWLKVNEPKLRTVQSMTLGGITPDGADAVSDLTYLCIEVVEEMKLPYPNVGVRVHEKNPPELMKAIARSIRAGGGQPMIMNDALWIENIKRIGFAEKYANDYVNMGCVEVMIPNKMQNWGVTEPIAFPMLFDELFRRYRTGSVKADTWPAFEEAYLSILDEAVDADYAEAQSKAKDKLNKCYEPFGSILVDGCLENGRDMFRGGSELGTDWCFYAYGLGTAADSLAAVKKHVYDDRRFTIDQLSEMLRVDFRGYERERRILENKTPHYGNGDAYVDALANDIMTRFDGRVLSFNKPGQRDAYVNTLFGYFFHIYHGEITDATPNGRHKGEPFSDSMGPSQGKDVNGPTAMLESVLSLDHSGVTGGYALNIKIDPQLVTTPEGLAALEMLIRGYVRGCGPQIQFNFVDAETLKKAKIEPEKHRDLIVRVGGYCEYFVNLDNSLQDEIITRTIHGI